MKQGLGRGHPATDQRFATPFSDQYGQKRAGPNFSKGKKVPESIQGKSLAEVSQLIATNKISTDVIEISVFNQGGQWVSANTRGLAAIYGAGRVPTNIKVIKPDLELTGRLGEPPLPGYAGLPAPSIPITPRRNDLRIIGKCSSPPRSWTSGG